MNQYGKDDPGYVPPGWTDWHALLGPSTYYFWDFGISEEGARAATRAGTRPTC